jgi:hypothetical protein
VHRRWLGMMDGGCSGVEGWEGVMLALVVYLQGMTRIE